MVEQKIEQDLDSIESALIQVDARCCSCNTSFSKGNIRSYDHTGGIKVKGFDNLQWVYMHCDKCDYDSALWKLIKQIKDRDWFEKHGEC